MLSIEFFNFSATISITTVINNSSVINNLAVFSSISIYLHLWSYPILGQIIQSEALRKMK